MSSILLDSVLNILRNSIGLDTLVVYTDLIGIIVVCELELDLSFHYRCWHKPIEDFVQAQVPTGLSLTQNINRFSDSATNLQLPGVDT